MTSPPAAPGMPSAEEIEAEIRPMSYGGADLTECVERILNLIRPAFEAKDAEAQNWQTRATVYKRLMTDAQRGKEAAEAKLAQAVEALEPFARFPAFVDENRWTDGAVIHACNGGTVLLELTLADLRRARSASAESRHRPLAGEA